MTTAAIRLRNELQETKKTTSLAKSRLRKKLTEERALVTYSGGAGTLASAAICGIVDAKFGEPGEPATIGDSAFPMNATGGVLALIAGYVAAKKSPKTAAFVFQGGAFALGSYVYSRTRDAIEANEG